MARRSSRRPGERPVNRPTSLTEWSRPEFAHRFVTRGELLSVLELHYKALRRLTWWYQFWLGLRALVGMHPKQIAQRAMRAELRRRRAEVEAERAAAK